MSTEDVPLALHENPFCELETLLDHACQKLQHKKAQYTLRRLRGLDEILKNLERELDVLARLNPSQS